MQDEIKKLIESQTLCEICNDYDDPNSFDVGYFLACDDEYYIVWYVNPYGFYNGMGCVPIDCLYRIQTDTAYLREIQLLMDRNDVSLNVKRDYGENVLIGFLKHIKSDKNICGIEVLENEHEDMFGRIDEVDEDNKLVKLSLVDVHGQNDGKAVVNVDTISEVYYQTRYTTKIEILNDIRK